MTRKEELQYLLGLTAEAAKWNVDEGDNAFELEVKLRMKTLVEELVDPTEVQVMQNIKKSKDAYRETHVRVRENGKVSWVRREDAEQVPTPNGLKWVRKKAKEAENGNTEEEVGIAG